MPLDHYVTLGRSGLRVSPLCLGAMTFGEDLGWGSSVEESQQIIDRYIELGGNFIDTANFYTKSHSEKIIGDHIGRHPARRDRLVIATKFSGNLYPGDPNGGGSGRKSTDRRLRELAAAPADRLHRPVLAAQLGRAHADRGDDGRARRPRAGRQGALPRRVGHAGVEDRRGKSHRAFPWLVVVHRAADRVLAARAHRRTGAGADGRGVRARDHAVVTAGWRCAQRQVHAKQRRPTQGRSRRIGGGAPQREDLCGRRRTRDHRQSARHHGRPRGAGLGPCAAGRDVDHHRRAPTLAARRQREAPST